MIKSKSIVEICNQVIQEYHKRNVLEPIFYEEMNPNELNLMIHKKCLVDTIQWHLEDEVRNPTISATQGWEIKKKIDYYNQLRTDIVENIDFLLYNNFQKVTPFNNASMNSETPGWIIDRISILCLKLFHMLEQTVRIEVSDIHRKSCSDNYIILKIQLQDLCFAFDILIEDLSSGNKIMKLFLQMKMYNNDQLNPVLYNLKK